MCLVVLLYGLKFTAYLLLPATTQILTTTTTGEHAATAEPIGPVAGVFRYSWEQLWQLRQHGDQISLELPRECTRGITTKRR